MPRKAKKIMLSAREERYTDNKIRKKNPRLSAQTLGGIVENTTGKKLCVTKQFAVCCISMAFMVEKSKKRPFMSRRNPEDRV